MIDTRGKLRDRGHRDRRTLVLDDQQIGISFKIIISSCSSAMENCSDVSGDHRHGAPFQPSPYAPIVGDPVASTSRTADDGKVQFIHEIDSDGVSSQLVGTAYGGTAVRAKLTTTSNGNENVSCRCPGFDHAVNIKDSPTTINYFYDEPVKDVTKKPAEYPIQGINLSDAWVVVILKFMTREEQCKNWPAVFTKRGLLRDLYVHKGQAAKMWDVQTKLFKYALVDGYHHMHGTEGALEQLPATKPEKPSKGADLVAYGITAIDQAIEYVPREAESESATPKDKKKTTTAKKSVEKSFKQPPTKRVTRQTEKKAKEEDRMSNEEDDEDEDYEEGEQAEEDEQAEEVSEEEKVVWSQEVLDVVGNVGCLWTRTR